VLPFAETLAIVAALLAVVLGLVAWLARRAYGGRTLGERRTALVLDENAAPAWRPEPGARDG
jgi:hypothetical protein